MIELDCIQGSPEWHDARLGVVTASAVSKILTPKTLKPSASAEGYLCELLAEWALGISETEFEGNFWTERGHQYEGEARAAIALIRDVEPRSVGFCFRDETRLAGCSPDALLGEDGGAEIKCPMGKQHLQYLFEGAVPSQYVPQIQMSLWVTGRDYWVFESYHPGLPPVLHLVEPESKWQNALDDHIPAFLDKLADRKAELKDMGVEPKRWLG